jgi:iron complex outermembrane receptor protein
MLKLSLILSLHLLVGAPGLRAQTALLSGTVKDSSTMEVLGSVNVSLQNSRLGASTNAEGAFEIRGVAPGAQILRAALIGYAEQELSLTLAPGESLHVEILLVPEHVEEEEVVVTATRTVRHIADVPVRVEAVPQEEVEEKILMSPSSVSMLLNESTGMRVQTTSATSNTANLRIQGLSGRYTQILIDGVPSFGGLAAGFGLTQIPPLNLRQVEVIKGASSVLFGADAIAGVVNFITKDPGGTPELSGVANATTQRGADLALFASRRFGDVGVTVLGSRNTQPLHDVDGDGFGDVAEYERYSVTPKVVISAGGDVTVRGTMGYLSEERIGGATNAPRSAIGTGAPYVEDLKTRRLDLASELDWSLAEGEAVAVKLAFMHLRRDAMYGSSPFNANQDILYADAQYAFTLGAHALLAGAAFTADDFEDRTPVVGAARTHRYTVPGFFVQDEITLSDQWTMLAGGRLDRHDTFGTFVTPRLSVMVRPSPSLTMRLGGGGGFKSPTIFTEEAEETGFRNVRPLVNAEAERASSASFDLNWRTLVGEVGVGVNVAFYATKVLHALVADEDSLEAGVVALHGASGATLARGGECSVKLTYDDWKLSLGYTYLYADQEDRGLSSEMALNPRHSFGAILFWESPEHGMKVGLENYWTGTQRLERNPYRDRSPAYWITGLVAEKALGPVRLFVNFEDMFDTRQTRFEPIIVGEVRTGAFRTLPTYAPLEGRVVNGGVRVVL